MELPGVIIDNRLKFVSKLVHRLLFSTGVSCRLPPEIIILMYFLVFWSRDLPVFLGFGHEILNFAFLVICAIFFKVFPSLTVAVARLFVNLISIG